ncbi:Polycystic kidney disease protein 1-like 1 [Acipenser ruthenus]|uniref:Polycystin-1-like protein 1 n=1 Tax=Acipenser ruthenus TaxID=7906 RepID=A0A444V3K2_ACIRT|nr:Polycystic kidney disease protein 1-like 1 [Acipenser ruthenus]
MQKVALLPTVDPITFGIYTSWYLGCYYGNSLGFADEQYEVLIGQLAGPSVCSKKCLEKGYNVIVNASNRLSSFTSDIYPITIQRKVEANRLLSDASVLVNASVAFDCRINSGTNVTYQWSFGDGTYKTGRSTEYHVFDRMGEFTVEVTVSNLVSSVSLTRQIFAVYEPCQPPPVKNMGPLKVQVRRNQDLNLRVTFEADIKCNISQGLLYSWTFFDSNDIPVELPLINTNMQIIYIPNNFLEYGRYTAVARVQIKGNVVYSNYTVPIEVIPTPPICVIDGGNNIFISSRNNSLITLNGEGSFDPDYPESILSFTWDCAPVSGIDSSCFDYNVSATASTFTIPAFILKSRFDQFQFTLTVQSRDRSSTAEVFVTIQESLLKTINVFCYQCIGNTVNWNEPFSVEAKCETCENILDLSFAWNLYLVNASNEDSTEVPFCKSLDVGGSSSLFIGPSHGGNHQATQAPPITVSPSTYPATSSNAFSVTIASPTSMSPNPANDTGSDSGISEGGGTASGGTANGGTTGGGSSSGDGSNLVDNSNSVVVPPPATLLDLNRGKIDNGIFKTYTSSGISSFFVTFKPFMLQPRMLYMLEVSTKYNHQILGKSQLFFSTNEVPKGMTCQVQPNRGYEISTDFSIFCTSGKEDLLYQYSFSIGNSSRKLLYEGRDVQYYFNLPAGDPSDGYKVTIYTEISNRFGARTKPCPVRVTVLPSFQRNLSSSYNPDEELYIDGLKNLSRLLLMGSDLEIRNYVILLTNVLNRLSLEPGATVELLTQTRSALIASVCGLQLTHQGALIDKLYMLNDLMEVKEQITFNSAKLVTGHVNDLSQRFQEPFTPDSYFLDEWTVRILVSLLSNAIEVPDNTTEEGIEFIADGIRTTRELLLINGDVADLSLYNCITRRKINIKGLTEPVNVEFEKTYRNESKSKFSLFRNKMNIHNFDVTSENLMEALQITLDFTRPAEKVFPIMLLLRMLEKPTPSVYNIQQIHSWESNTAQIVLPAGSLKDTGSYYLALLNADYNRTARNKYIASAVNYTITIQWTQCLYWDDIKQWKSDGCSPVQGLSSNKVNCSCNHLTTFTMVNRQISSNYDFTDVSQFISLINNLVPCMVIFFILLIYILLVIACKQADLYSEKKTGSVLLQDNNPSDQQLYSIIIDTGFRSRAGTTAKVHIVLHGEDGVSETRELDCPDKPLFSRNSRHTFILSTPDSLGPLWKVHLWHNNGGQSPSWYVSHVIVKDLVTGMSWFFPAECWLAVDEGDGKVERELTSLSHGPGFKKFTAELGLIDISAVSLVTGIFSTLAALPFGVLLSLLFRFSKRGLESRSPIIVSEQDSQSNSKKEGTCASDCSSSGFEDCSSQENSKVPPKCFEHSTSDLRSDSSLDRSLYEHHQVFGSSTIVLPFWCRYLAWAACLLLAIVCIVVTVLLGLKFSGTKSLLWIHSLFFSLLFCIFVVQPLVIFILASVVSLREFVLYIVMLLLLMFVTYGKFSNDQYLLNQAVRTEFTKNPKKLLSEVKTAEDWWSWSMTALLEGLYWDTWYNNASASAKLSADRWLDRSTRAVVVEFTLYNPPSNLFTTVSLLAETPPTGGVIPSAYIESVSIYHVSSVLDYFIMAFEVTIIIISLFYYTYYMYHFVLAVEIIDYLQRGNFKAFVDLSLISSWDQLTRCLHGVMIFLLLLKCIRLLRINKVISPCVTMLRLSCSSITLPVVAGIIFMIAYSCLGNLLFLSTSHPFSTIVRSFQTVLMHFMGVSELQTLSSMYKTNQLSIAIYYGTFFFILSVLWIGMIAGVLTSLAQDSKKSSRSKHLVTLTEVVIYTREKFLAFIGRKRQNSSDSPTTGGSNFYLDEFETLMDELLFRLNAFSNSLHRSLPAKQRNYLGDESPLISQSDYYYSPGSESASVNEDSVGKKVYKIEQKLFKNNPEMYNLLMSTKENDLASQRPLRSQLETETFHHLHLQNHGSPSVTSVDNSENCKSSHTHSQDKPSVTLPGSTNPSSESCASMSDSCSLPEQCSTCQTNCAVNPDHYNLAKLGDDLPHVLCGTKCPEKLAAQSIESRTSHQQRSTSASLSSRSRKPLKRSHTTIIKPLECPIEVTGSGAGNNDEDGDVSEEKTSISAKETMDQPIKLSSPERSSQHSNTKGQRSGPKVQEGSNMKKDKQKKPKKADCHFLIPEDVQDSDLQNELPVLPESLRQCW